MIQTMQLTKRILLLRHFDCRQKQVYQQIQLIFQESQIQILPQLGAVHCFKVESPFANSELNYIILQFVQCQFELFESFVIKGPLWDLQEQFVRQLDKYICLEHIIMIAQLWSKEVTIEVRISTQDNADWCPALPLLFNAKWNHYVGFYYPLIQQFFSAFQPFPNQTNAFWVELAQNNTALAGTQIVSNLLAIYSLNSNEPIQMICHFRGEDQYQVDLKRFFKNNLKASTCIRYGKFGSSVITVDMTVNNIDDMFNNFKQSQFQAYLGSKQTQAANLGYHFIVNNDEKIESLGVRIIGKQFTIQRKVAKQSLLSSLWNQLVGNQSLPLLLHGVALRELQIKFIYLQNYCHPDGFLYFTVG